MSAGEIVLAGLFSCGKLKLGACLLISGEGISCGSRPRLITMKMARHRPRNSPKGISKYLFMLFHGRGCRCGRDFDDGSLCGRLKDFLLRERVTTIADCKGA